MSAVVARSGPVAVAMLLHRVRPPFFCCCCAGVPIPGVVIPIPVSSLALPCVPGVSSLCLPCEHTCKLLSEKICAVVSMGHRRFLDCCFEPLGGQYGDDSGG